MRGEHPVDAWDSGSEIGIIPACAGSTSDDRECTYSYSGSSPHARGAPLPRSHTCTSALDHPRMRGEHWCRYVVLVAPPGIIPACAGSTQYYTAQRFTRSGSSPHARGARSTRASSCTRSRDHPRMRGEHKSHLLLLDVRHGIIPACAGSTVSNVFAALQSPGSSPHARGAPAGRARAGSRTRDHPRMRGEHAPRGRGPRRGQGIIPACAGSTSDETSLRFCVMGSSPHARGALLSCWSISPRPRDHPRMRGEHLVDLRERYRLPGIIPACAGSTPSVLEIKTASAGSSPHARGARRPTQDAVGTGGDHPRMRGEHWGIE